MKRTIRKTIAAVMSLIVTIGAFSLNGLKAYADSDNVDISSKYATKLNVGDYDNYLRMNDSFFFMSDTDKSSETVKKSNTYDCINLNADSKIKYVDMCLMGSIIFCILNLDIKKQKEILK